MPPSSSAAVAVSVASAGGGIVLRGKDSERLAAHVGLPLSIFHARFTEMSRGKRRLVCEESGACVFFRRFRVSCA